jgi:competence protein ComEA
MARKLNLNDASVDDLAKVPGIDQRRAEILVQYREEHGDFEDWNDLDNIPGFSQGMVDKMKREGLEL